MGNGRFLVALDERMGVRDFFYPRVGLENHAGAPLAEGTLAGEDLTCPWHGSQFKVTDGSVLRGPTEKPLKVYPSTVNNGSVFIDI